MTAQGQNDFLGTSNNVHALSSIAWQDVTTPSLDQWANVSYNMQPDNTRNRRMGKVKIPDILVVSFFTTSQGCYFHKFGLFWI